MPHVAESAAFSMSRDDRITLGAGGQGRGLIAAEVDAFEARWAPDKRERTAFKLLRHADWCRADSVRTTEP